MHTSGIDMIFITEFAYIHNDCLLYKDNESNMSVWPGNGGIYSWRITYLFSDGIPPDGTPVIVIDSLNPLLTIIVCLLSAVCIIFALFCCLFMLIFRKRRLVLHLFDLMIVLPTLGWWNWPVLISTILLWSVLFYWVLLWFCFLFQPLIQ